MFISATKCSLGLMRLWLVWIRLKFSLYYLFPCITKRACNTLECCKPIMAEWVGFEPMCRPNTDKTISSRWKNGTVPHRASWFITGKIVAKPRVSKALSQQTLINQGLMSTPVCQLDFRQKHARFADFLQKCKKTAR